MQSDVIDQASARIALAVVPPSPNAGGWQLASGAAIKLWMTLQHFGDAADSTAEQLAMHSGIGQRSLTKVFSELAALHWITYTAERGSGYAWELLGPPDVLTNDAIEYYADKIERRKAAVKRDEDRLDQAKIGSQREQVGGVAVPLRVQSPFDNEVTAVPVGKSVSA